MVKTILLTGGLGYIGSHTCVELIKNGYEVIILDNLSNSKIEVLDKLKKLTNRDIKFYKSDLTNLAEIKAIFKNESIDAIIHFAGLKAVGESVEKPLSYYNNNIYGTLNLLIAMEAFNVKNLVFSSSATVYSPDSKMPLNEDAKLGPVNPYGRTKLFIEEILQDEYVAHMDMNIVILRYFNPVGAHESGLIGEDPNNIPNNLMPYICRVATGELPILKIFGNDYPTPDGTGIRDYIHVCDLADGHVKALDKINENCGLKIYNLGTGIGYSVLDIVNAYNKICGNKVKYQFAPRRNGDVAINYSCPDKAKSEMNWVARYNIQDMCESAYNFQTKQKDKG